MNEREFVWESISEKVYGSSLIQTNNVWPYVTMVLWYEKMVYANVFLYGFILCYTLDLKIKWEIIKRNNILQCYCYIVIVTIILLLLLLS